MDLVVGGWYYPQMMRESGVISVWYLVLTLSVTPTLLILRRLKRGQKLGAWLLKRRKHFGLASFFFAAIHVTHYVRETADLGYILGEATRTDYLMGWAGFLIMLVLALTSNRWATRKLGRNWKPLHRTLYPGAACIFLHWYLFLTVTQTLVIWLSLVVAAKLIHVILRYAPQARRVKPKRAEQRPSSTGAAIS